MATISNNWITLSEQRNGVTVQRKFAGIKAEIDVDDNVTSCIIEYWERELYPNGSVIKTEKKKYRLEDLAYTEVTENGTVYHMDPLAVLSGYIATVGNPYIIGPARETLESLTTLPLNVEDNYPLRRDTREKLS